MSKVYLVGAIGNWYEEKHTFVFGAQDTLEKALQFMKKLFLLPENADREVFCCELDVGREYLSQTPYSFLPSFKHYTIGKNGKQVVVKNHKGICFPV